MLSLSDRQNKLVRDHPMIIHVLFGFNQINSIWELGFYFRIRSYIKTIVWDDGYLGIPIEIKTYFVKDNPINI